MSTSEQTQLPQQTQQPQQTYSAEYNYVIKNIDELAYKYINGNEVDHYIEQNYNNKVFNSNVREKNINEFINIYLDRKSLKSFFAIPPYDTNGYKRDQSTELYAILRRNEDGLYEKIEKTLFDKIEEIIRKKINDYINSQKISNRLKNFVGSNGGKLMNTKRKRNGKRNRKSKSKSKKVYRRKI